MIPNYVFMKHLTDCNYFPVNTVLIEVLIDTKVDFNLLDSILSLIEDMLNFEYLSKSSLTQQTLLIK